MWFHKHINQAKQSHLNMRIARAHELATQLVGIQLAAANLLALAISMASIVAGCVTYAVLNKPGAWPFWLAAGGIGCGLALLIEGMTLGALIRIRLANKQIRAIVLQLEAERDQALAAGKIVGRWKFWRRKRYATRNYRKSRRSSIPLAVIGASASATAGGLFYHQMLASLGWYESIGVSALFALIVTGTFVSSELYKDLQEEAVREGFRGGSLSEEALREETYRQTNQAVAVEVSSYLTSQEAKTSITEAAKQVLGDVLSELRQRSVERTGRVPVVQGSDTTPASQPVTSVPRAAGDDTPDTTRQAQGDTMALPESFTTGATRPSDSQARGDQQDVVRETRPTTGPLDMIEQAMLSAIQKATEAERSDLLTMAATQPLPALTRTLQARYPRYATFFTDTRVARVMEAFQATNVRHVQQNGHDTTITCATERHQDDNDMRVPGRHDKSPQDDNDIRVPGRHDRSPQDDNDDFAPGRHDDLVPGRHDSTIRPFRKATEATAEDATPERATQATDTTAKGDLTARRILAYQAEHPGAKQAEIAAALGVTVRTVQRKLTALKTDVSAG